MITLKNLLSTLTYDDDTWIPEVIHTIATEGKGTDELLKSIISHQTFIKDKGIQRQKFEDRYHRRVKALIYAEFQQRFWDEAKTVLLQSEVNKGQKDWMSPHVLAKKLLEI